MPTSGTHITIVQRVAISDPDCKNLLGDPMADDTTSEGRKARFANLGAVGPDIFYALADYGADLQDLENFLMKVGGSFECVAELMGKVSRYIDGVESEITLGVSDSLHDTFNLIGAVFKEGLMALVVDGGVNLWPVFQPARQKDRPRKEWFWADYLHYIRSGKFVCKLLELARASDNENLLAYALGYLTHYVTDVVGHPYVNQVVQAPWRLYWQRHHLVENFIDAYVWDRWHIPQPPPAPPSTEEQPLDIVTKVPNTMGTGAPFTFARLNDLIAIGTPTLGDPVDSLVEAICQKIEKGLFDIGVAENMDAPAPNNSDFSAWTNMMYEALRSVYDEPRHPLNLATGLLGNPRPDGYPLPEDIAAAYSTMRLVLKLATEEKIQEPHPPDIRSDISAAVEKLASDIAKNINSIPPAPHINTSGSFSWDSLWDAVRNVAKWLGEAAAGLGKAIFDFILDSIAVAGTVISDSIKYALYLFNKFLFSLYRSFRDVLMLAAYSVPFTDQLTVNMGGPFNTASLWRWDGNQQYPVEERAEEVLGWGSHYAPMRPPASYPDATFELPPVTGAAPYRPGVDGNPTLPDDFIDAPRQGDMFDKKGPLQLPVEPDKESPNFGGAIANCIRGIQLAMQGFPDGTDLPDYNLDGDRGYAWPTWDVDPPPDDPKRPPNLINPIQTKNNNPAQVNAVSVSG